MIEYPLSVFLDTNIFISNKYDFGESSTLQLFANLVNQDKIKIFVSDIVIRETEKHIKADIAQSISSFKKTRKSILKILSPSIIEDTHYFF